MPIAHPPAERPRCHITVWWFDADMEARCVRPHGHQGPHRDGVCWWDQHGLRIPHSPQTSAETEFEGRGLGAGWKERTGAPRQVNRSVRRATDRRMAGHRSNARLGSSS